MSIPTDPIEGYYAQQAPTPSARELVDDVLGRTIHAGTRFPPDTLATRVEAVLELIDSRWQVPAEVIVAQIKRILNGEKP